MNTLHLTCENPDELLAGFGAGARINIQTSATQAGAYSNVGYVALVAATRSYTYEHLAGISTTWYKVRFEDSTGANANDYGTPFQVGDETAGLLCSLYDVKQQIGNQSSTTDDETIIEIIRQVSDDIEDYVGQWLAPRPTNPTDTTTLLFDVPYEGGWSGWGYHKSLLLDRGSRLTGIRSFTAVGIATTDQPDTGGTYTSATLADLLIRPFPNSDGPGYRLIFSNYPTGSVNRFYPGMGTVTITGSFGPASVAPRIQAVAVAATIRRFIGKEQQAPLSIAGPDGGVRILAEIPPSMRDTLKRMRIPNAA